MADGRRARGCVAGGRDPGVAGAGLQPARARASPRGGARRRPRLAGRPDGAARRRPVYGGRRGVLRARPERAPGRRERTPRTGAERSRVRPGCGAGADGPWRDRVPRADSALRGMSPRSSLPVARPPLRAAAPARAVRGLVPAAAGGDATPCGRRRNRPGRTGRGSCGLAREGRARPGRGRTRIPACVARYHPPMVVSAIVTLLIPLWILLGLLVLIGIFALLGRVRGGRYLRPVVGAIAKVPLFRRG